MNEANVLRERCNELEWELAQEVRMREDCAHGVISLRTALALEKERRAEAEKERDSYRQHMEVLLAQRGEIQKCGERCAREAA